ncbi:hypothetical protein [Saccharopolyspora endophytica]|uniref:Uncharacterized protein n=1 Tax=Saccharopolyspora endophytica TaxID=543886 RepID=A0A0C5BH89_9PSEU|nr:hypothetical protein [Saccharopolyspora endophytica]AJM87324.1 hypothetical protein pCM32.11 [Saccharopolyspora endophytica]MBQ0928831.1 hypothetical protein [Saccharopolyspora endophytica]
MLENLLNLGARGVLLLAAAAGVLAVAALVVTWRAVLPAVLIGLLAIGSGLVRTVALAGFLLIAVLRVLMVGIERLGYAVPAPRLRARKVVTA